MKSKTINTVATGLDDKYLLPFLIMIFSASKNSEFDFEIAIAYGQDLLSPASRKVISDVLEILEVQFEFMPIELDLKIKKHYHIEKTAFARLYLADILPKPFLWLDSDLICLPGWDHIFVDNRSSVAESAVCAVVDTAPVLMKSEVTNNHVNAAVARMGSNYFNSGVMLVNPEEWKILNREKHWLELYSSFEQLGFQFADQCLINFLCHKSYTHLDPSWNVQTLARQRRKTTREARIMHFVGPQKPWSYKKNEIAMFFSEIKAVNISLYLKYQEDFIGQMEISDPDLGKFLRSLEKVNQKNHHINKKKILSRFIPNLISYLI